VASKEELKAAIHAAFEAAVPDGATYTKVYASDMKQKNDGQFRLAVVPSIPKIAAGFYQLPVDQKAEYEAFQAVRNAVAG
jgi:hypothetical protein